MRPKTPNRKKTSLSFFFSFCFSFRFLVSENILYQRTIWQRMNNLRFPFLFFCVCRDRCDGCRFFSSGRKQAAKKIEYYVCYRKLFLAALFDHWNFLAMKNSSTNHSEHKTRMGQATTKKKKCAMKSEIILSSRPVWQNATSLFKPTHVIKIPFLVST